MDLDDELAQHLARLSARYGSPTHYSVVDAREAFVLYESMRTEELLTLQAAHRADLAAARTPEGIAFGAGRLALIAAVLSGRGVEPTPPLRLRYQTRGGHVHCRVFGVGSKHGDLVFSIEEWPTVRDALASAFTLIDEDPGAECVCRNRSCGHPASRHVGVGGQCIEPGCTCGPGGWT